jgi:aromatic ring-opening dioxygenase catalytic subunit (LigB family)
LLYKYGICEHIVIRALVDRARSKKKEEAGLYREVSSSLALRRQRDSLNKKMRMPVAYIPHGGGPCFFMKWDPVHEWDTTATYLRGLVDGLETRPSALVVISAHWEAPSVSITSQPEPDLIYDYHGFPAHTYELSWPAPGSPHLANRIASLLTSASILDFKLDDKRGLDHGIFVPMKVSVPEADIPVVAVSLVQGLSPEKHQAIGAALEPLRDEGVLLIGSGMSFHNMSVLMAPSNGDTCDPASEAFDAWLKETLQTEDPIARSKQLSLWKKAPFALQCHPREEHLAPLFVVAGAAGKNSGRQTFSDIVMGVRISAFEFSD